MLFKNRLANRVGEVELVKKTEKMNENIDLTKILEGCPLGTKFYSPIYGEVEFEGIYENSGYIKVREEYGTSTFGPDGRYLRREAGGMPFISIQGSEGLVQV